MSKTDLAVAVGARIRAARKAAGLTQQELADRASMAKMAVSNWERGVLTPSVPSIVALSKALDVPVDSLLFDEEAA